MLAAGSGWASGEGVGPGTGREEEAVAVAAPPPRSEGKRRPRGRKERRRKSGAGGGKASADPSRCLGRGSQAAGVRAVGDHRHPRAEGILGLMRRGRGKTGEGPGVRGGLGPSRYCGKGRPSRRRCVRGGEPWAASPGR